MLNFSAEMSCEYSRSCQASYTFV